MLAIYQNEWNTILILSATSDYAKSLYHVCTVSTVVLDVKFYDKLMPSSQEKCMATQANNSK